MVKKGDNNGTKQDGRVKNIQKRRLSSRTQIFHGNKYMDKRKKALEAFHKMKAWVEQNEPEIAKKVAKEMRRSILDEEL